MTENRGTVDDRDRMLMEADMTNPIDESKQSQQPKPEGGKVRRRNKGRLEEAKQFLMNIFAETHFEPWLQTSKGQESLQIAYDLQCDRWTIKQRTKQMNSLESES